MQIGYCETCGTKLSDAEFESGLAVWINSEPYCKECGEKVQAAAPASKSGPRLGSRSGIQRATPSGTHSGSRSVMKRATPGGTRPGSRSGIKRATPSGTRPGSRSDRRRTTPNGTPRRSGIHRPQSETAARRTSGRYQGPTSASDGTSMVLVSVVGATIGVILAVIVIVLFLK